MFLSFLCGSWTYTKNDPLLRCLATSKRCCWRCLRRDDTNSGKIGGCRMDKWLRDSSEQLIARITTTWITCFDVCLRKCLALFRLTGVSLSWIQWHCLLTRLWHKWSCGQFVSFVLVCMFQRGKWLAKLIAERCQHAYLLVMQCEGACMCNGKSIWSVTGKNAVWCYRC